MSRVENEKLKRSEVMIVFETLEQRKWKLPWHMESLATANGQRPCGIVDLWKIKTVFDFASNNHNDDVQANDILHSSLEFAFFFAISFQLNPLSHWMSYTLKTAKRDREREPHTARKKEPQTAVENTITTIIIITSDSILSDMINQILTLLFKAVCWTSFLFLVLCSISTSILCKDE